VLENNFLESSNTPLPRSRSIRNWSLRHRQHRLYAIRIADIKQHSFRHNSAHLPRLQIHDEERLLPFQLSRIRSLLFDARDDHARVVAKVYAHLAQLVCIRNVGYGFDGTNANVDLVQNIHTDGSFDWGGIHAPDSRALSLTHQPLGRLRGIFYSSIIEQHAE